METKDLEAARNVLAKAAVRDGSITTEFAWIGKGNISFSHRDHTKTEARYIPTS
jgi:hypothetical protein